MRARLILLVLLTGAPAFALVVYNGHAQREQAEQNARRLVLSAAWAVANGVQTHVSDGLNLVRRLAHEPEAQALRARDSGTACSTLLARLLQLDSDYSDITLTDLKGEVRCSARPLPGPVNVADREYFQDVRQHLDTASSGYHVSRISGLKAVSLAHPVFDARGSGELLGLAVVGIDLTFAKDLLSRVPLPPGTVMSMVDREGRLLMRSPYVPGILGTMEREWENWRALADKEVPVELTSHWRDGRRRLSAIVPIHAGGKEPAYYVRVGLPEDELFAEAERQLAVNLGLLSAALALALLLGWAFSHRLLMRPLTTLAETADRLSRGDNKARARLATGGEIGRLGQALDHMADELEQREAGLKQAGELRRQLLARMEGLQDEERKRIARELHDSLGQFLTAMSLSIAGFRQQGLEAAALERLAILQRRLDEVDRELDRVIFMLRPTGLEDHGLKEGVAVYAHSWSSLTRVPVDLMSRGLEETSLPPRVEAAVFRVIQEALNNTAKYAQAQNVSLSLECLRRELIVSVEDDGVGFDHDDSQEPASGQLSWGLLGMKERIEAVGGTFAVESAVGAGTTILARVPLS